MRVRQIGSVEIVLYRGDITMIEVDAIANAANSSLLGGGGVDGAIHRAAGPRLDAECAKLYYAGGCPPGEARITSGGNLPARWVIHTVGPIWEGGSAGEPEVLANCYRHSIALAQEKGLHSLIFPSISTGAFGYPVELAAQTARKTVEQSLATPGSLREVGWCLFDQRTFDIYTRVWGALPSGKP